MMKMIKKRRPWMACFASALLLLEVTGLGAAPPLDILFLGANDAGDAGADAEVMAFLEQTFSGGTITYMNSGATDGSEVADVIVMSSTFGSGSVRGKFHNSPVGILNWEEALMDSGAGEFGQSLVSMTKSTDVVTMNLGNHPAAGDLAGLTIDFFIGAGPETLGSAELSAGTEVVGTAADGSISGLPMLFVTEPGEDVGESAGIVGNISPARRVAFPMTDNSFNELTEEGKQLLANAIIWAASADIAPPRLDILFLGANDAGDAGADAEVLAFLEQTFSGGTITYMNSGATDGSEVADVIVMSSTFGSGSVRGKFHNSPVGILNWEEAIMDAGAGEFGQSLVSMTKSTDVVTMNLSDHPAAGDLAGLTIDFFTGAGPETLGSAELSSGTEAVGTAADGSISGLPMLFVTEAGEDVAEGAGIDGNISPARRVAFPMTDNSFNELTEEGKATVGQRYPLGRISGQHQPGSGPALR